MEVNMEVKIDYFSATFPLICDADDSVKLRVDEMVMLLATYLNVENFEILYKPTAQNNFHYQVDLGKHIILRLDGPLNKYYQRTCHLEMKGEGCRDFEKRNPDKTWLNLILFMVQLNATFKRIDIAIDDYKGDVIDIKWLFDKVITNDYYTSIFKSKPKPIGWFSSGMTIQFGSNQSQSELVIYDKKKEREHRKEECDKIYWVRFEMRFRESNAEAIAYMIAKTFDDKDISSYGTRLQKFAKAQLYRMLDIKEDTNLTLKNINKAQTDPKWLKFLDNVDKGGLFKPQSEDEVKLFEDYEDYFWPDFLFYLIVLYLKTGRKRYIVETEIWKNAYKRFALTKYRFQRLNIFLKQLNIATVDDDDFAQIKEEFKEILEDKELPF